MCNIYIYNVDINIYIAIINIYFHRDLTAFYLWGEKTTSCVVMCILVHSGDLRSDQTDW